MLVIELEFLTGRFHMTPWGRHVNEAVTEWPPSPYRFIRALYDVWKRKRPDWSTERIEPLFEMLASSAPEFYLPHATEFSTRSYLSENSQNVVERQLIFDGFVVLNPESKVIMGWTDLHPTPEQKQDLDELLRLLNYFGRSESWVQARVNDNGAGIRWNCYPAGDGEHTTKMQSRPVATPVSKAEYEAKPFIPKSTAKKGKLPPVSWLDALAWTTDDMIQARMSEPPALRFMKYLRPAHCFEVVPTPKSRVRKETINAVMYALESKVPPRVQFTLDVAEQVRVRLMGIHKIRVRDPARVSEKFSGKNPDGTSLKGHKHTFILPLDLDDDGKIDHLLIRCKDPFDDAELAALDHLTSLRQPDGKPDIRCIPIQWGRFGEVEGTQPAKIFRSETPFVPPRHYRKGRGDFGEWLAGEVKREAQNHDMPEPVAVRPLARLKKQGRSVFWLEFRRNRKADEAGLGYGFELEFSEPVPGPFTLGYGAHFGLGLFVPVEGSHT
ncbi:MAG: type I-U CRISPR-associated protein Csb2 [Methanoregula sp.]|nr:type I-U CRISPR-associated protein Csb2 [Methanoregula sp.]